MTTLITATTILLPIAFGPGPAMRGQQQIAVVYLDTPRASWSDTTDARGALDAALAWWEARALVSFSVAERRETTEQDLLAENICRADWRPVVAQPTLYLVATGGEPLTCDGVIVGDYTAGQAALVWGILIRDSPTDQATLAHTLAHLYGAPDQHDPPSGDLMDRACYVEACKAGRIGPVTWRAIGAVPR